MAIPGGTDASLDGSWPEVLLYAHLKGWQFGRDLAFTWGPLGFLNNQFHLGDNGSFAKLLWETVGKLGIATALVGLTRKVPVLWQVLFIVSCICFNWLFLDTVFLVLITLIVVTRFLSRDTPRWQLVAWMVALAFLGQIKFTYTLFGCAGLLTAVVFAACDRNRISALLLAAGFPAIYALVWLLSGQNPVNLPAYFFLSFQISSGYGDAMGVDETWAVFASGVTLAIFCGVFVGWLWERHKDRLFGIIAAVYLAFTWFITWKHGFVRADGHVLGFILYSLLLALVLPSICFPGKCWHWFQLAAVLAVGCIEIFQAALPRLCPEVALARFRENSANLIHVFDLPARWRNEFETAARKVDLPAIKQAVRNSTVDVFNYDQGVALLNHLNYSPRPNFQSFAAYTPLLMRDNLRFYQSPRAPDYVIWKQISIDSRYPTTDDALLVPELPRAYQPVLEENGYLLLKKACDLPGEKLKRELLLTRSLHLGEVLTLPETGTAPVWIQANLPLNKLGKLRAFLYKPPLIYLTVTDETGRESSWRILPRIAKEGFLLSPLLETQTDFVAFCHGLGRHWIRSLRLEAPGNQKEYWARIWNSATIRLYTLPELKLDQAPVLRELVDAGITNLLPENAKAGMPMEPFMIGSTKALFFHARASLTFNVPEHFRKFSGAFGIRATAYEGEAHTDGVEFMVAALAPNGTKTILWRRLLDPLHQTGDRGIQTFSVDLPLGAENKIVLETLPGPHDNTDWDWSYVATLRFEPAAPSP